VNIKWGKEKFEDVHCNTDEPPIVFKAALFSLSGVQPDRQKVMYKGVVIKVSCKVVLICLIGNCMTESSLMHYGSRKLVFVFAV